MEPGSRWRHFRVVLPITLLVMILMRLVWMQLRSYPAQTDRWSQGSIAFLNDALGMNCQVARTPKSGAEDRSALDSSDSSRRTHGLSWALSPGVVLLEAFGCRAGHPIDLYFIRLNQWFLVLTVLSATLMTRFLTSSWTMSLVVAAVLMSRGSLLTGIGSVGIDGPLIGIFTLWFTCSAHFLRTGSTAMLVLASLTVFVGALVDWSMAGVALATPLMLWGGYLLRRQLMGPVLKRFREVRRGFRSRQRLLLEQPPAGAERAPGRGPTLRLRSLPLLPWIRWILGWDTDSAREAAHWQPSDQRGSLLGTISAPFAVWVAAGQRSKKLAAVWVGVFATTLVLAWTVQIWVMQRFTPAFESTFGIAESASFLGPWMLEWLANWLAGLDLHILASLALICLSAVQSPADGLLNFFEAVWLFLLSLVIMLVFACAADFMDAFLSVSKDLGQPKVLAGRNVLAWTLPVLLSLGVASAFNLMKVLNTKKLVRRTRVRL